MRNTKTILAIIIFLSLLVLSGCKITRMVVEKEPVTLGYCPTMTSLANEIQSNNNHVLLKAYGSTGEALSDLNREVVDAVLVGRIAKKSELDNAFEKRLGNGLTLVGQEKRMIYENNLDISIIHTYVSKEKAREYIPKTANITYHDSFELTVEKGLNELMLIDWKDYSDDLELVIPIDQYGKKVEKFRIPVLYSYNEEVIIQLEV